MKIIQYPNEILKTVSKSVEAPLSLDIINEMYSLMKTNNGVGLAAIQVGIPQRFFILDVGNGLKVYVNPEITTYHGTKERVKEGCLSFVGFFEKVWRYPQVTVTYWDMHLNNKCVETLTGLSAQAFAHELEHLEGLTFIDYLSNVERSIALNKYRLIKRKAKRNE